MKKIALLLLFVLSLIFIGGCEKKPQLTDYVTDLREAIYTAEGENFTLKIYYGFKETPFENDGAVGTRINYLTVRLLDVKNAEAEYTFSSVINGNELSGTFTYNPVAHALSLKAELNEMPPDRFEVKISSAAFTETVTARNVIPKDTISYQKALESLQKNQQELIDNYISDGKFTAEIYLRILIQKEKPYWYVGLAKNNKITALLIDGLTGEVLAVKTLY